MSRFVILPRRGTVDDFKKCGKLTEEKDFRENEMIVVQDKKVFLLSSPDKDIDQLIDDWYSPKTNEVIDLIEYYNNKNHMNNIAMANFIIACLLLFGLILAIMTDSIAIMIVCSIFFILFCIILLKYIKNLKELKKPEILVDWEERHGNNSTK